MVRSIEIPSSSGGKTTVTGGLIIGGIVAIVSLLAVFGSWYTVDQTQRAVLLRNGAFVEVVQPGLHFKWPFIEDVKKIDMQTHTHTWGGKNQAGQDVRFEAYSADQQPAHVRVSVTLHVAPDKVAEIYNRFGGDVSAAVTRLISPHVNEKVKNVFGQYSAARAISDRGKLNADAHAAVIQAIAYDPVFGIESVQLEDIQFSVDYIKSVEQRMQAEVEVQRFQQNLAKEVIQAKIVVTQAQAQADSTLARAKAEADARVLTGEAEGKAIKARGDALAQNPNLVSLVAAERWNGATPTHMIPGGALPFVTLDTQGRPLAVTPPQRASTP